MVQNYDRTNELHLEYYRLLADINYIAWCALRETQEIEGSIHMPGFDRHNLKRFNHPKRWLIDGPPQPSMHKPFNLREQIGLLIQVGEPKSYPLLNAMEISLREPYFKVMNDMWLVTHNTVAAKNGKLLQTNQRGMEIFGHQYFLDLYRTAQELGNNPNYAVRSNESKDFELEGGIMRGTNTGSRTTLNLLLLEALNGDTNFDATNAAIMLSKIHLHNISDLRKHSELYVTNSAQKPITLEDTKAFLADAEELTVNKKLLQEYGLGEAVGCIASIPPSEGALQFCAEVGLATRGKTMLADFVDYARPMVFNVFRDALDHDVRSYIKPEDLRILTGEDRRLPRAEGRCPHPHGGQESLTS